VTHLIVGLNGPWWFAMNFFQARVLVKAKYIALKKTS
jgi:hypothetical protein